MPVPTIEVTATGEEEEARADNEVGAGADNEVGAGTGEVAGPRVDQPNAIPVLIPQHEPMVVDKDIWTLLDEMEAEFLNGNYGRLFLYAHKCRMYT